MSVALPIVEPSSDFLRGLLQEQQSLTAIERFSDLHDRGALPMSADPAQARYYRDLMPASPPGPGQQFAFQVDLDKCSGCKACVVACHTMNGLDEEESWRRVGTVTSHDALPRIQHVTTACHHCVDPGCLNGCPVKAYEKDPSTGIVRHLDDQCIGCKYCTMMCPYEVPQYNERLGIVRKCDMCHQRLSVGEAPACVQSCPNEAIAITIVDVHTESLPADKVSWSVDQRLAPGAPRSSITQPTTRFVAGNPSSFAMATAQDAGLDQVADSHWPLAVLLVLTQASVGLLVAERVLAFVFWMQSKTEPDVAMFSGAMAWLVAGIGMALGGLHLGQPLRAWRVFLGLATSWLSREAIVLGKYMGLLSIALGLSLLTRYHQQLPDAWVVAIESRVSWDAIDWLASAIQTTAAMIGLVGLFCSAMIYVVTRRQLWRAQRTFAAFGGTMVIGGLSLMFPVLTLSANASVYATVTFVLLASICLLKLEWERRLRWSTNRCRDADDQRSRHLVIGPLRRWMLIRFQLGGIGLAISLLSFASVWMNATSLAVMTASTAACLLIGGEVMERLIYFSSVVYDRMPGTLR